MNKIDKSLARLAERKNPKNPNQQNYKWKGDIATNTTETQRLEEDAMGN